MKKKHSGDKDALDAELKTFYGPLFCYDPESYEILAGYEKQISAAATFLQSKGGKPRGNRSSVFQKKGGQSSSESQAGTSQTSPSEHVADIIIKEKDSLEKLLTKWLSTECFSTDSDDPSQLIGSVAAHVIDDGVRSFFAYVPCPFPGCSNVTKIRKNVNRWNS